MTGSKKIWIPLLVLLTVFLGWRLTRWINIFVIEEKFAQPLAVDIPAGLTEISARSCGACHVEIYREWSESIHAQAWTDPYFQVDWAFENLPQNCVTCHTPLADQQEELVVRYRDADKLDPVMRPNPRFDRELQREGVTCAACHLREGTIIGVHAVEDAPHPVRVDPAFLSRTSPCERCHVVSGERWDMFYRIPPCGTAAEIGESGRKPDCVGCHLPRVTRPVVPGGVARTGGRHLFRGGHHPPTVASALTVSHRRERDGAGERFVVTLTNSGAGHYLPTGTPDRHLSLVFRLLDARGGVLREERHIMKRTILWRPVIVDLWDTRLPADVPRDFVFAIGDGEGAVALDVTVNYHLLEESRRRRIGYVNDQPIFYPIHHRRHGLGAEGDGEG